FYGFELIGLTTVLAATLDLAFIRRAFDWERTPVRLLMALLIQVLIAPVLIRKKPGSVPPAFHPLWVWTVMNLPFAVGESVSDIRLRAGIRVGVARAVVLGSLIGIRPGQRAPASG